MERNVPLIDIGCTSLALRARLARLRGKSYLAKIRRYVRYFWGKENSDSGTYRNFSSVLDKSFRAGGRLANTKYWGLHIDLHLSSLNENGTSLFGRERI